MPRAKKTEAPAETLNIVHVDVVLEKPCPTCGTVNHSSRVQDKGKAYAAILFECRKCSAKYQNWWYGSSPALGGDPLWHDLVRRPFKAICTHAEDGITIEHIYDAFESLEHEHMFVIVKDDKGNENTEHSEEYFIADNKRRR